MNNNAGSTTNNTLQGGVFVTQVGHGSFVSRWKFQAPKQKLPTTKRSRNEKQQKMRKIQIQDLLNPMTMDAKTIVHEDAVRKAFMMSCSL